MKACSTCGSTQTSLWSEAGLRRCDLCGHAWQIKIKPFKYGGDYAAAYDKRPAIEMSWVRIAHLFRFLRSGRVLDIGYGNGEFIRQSLKAGYQAFGYDTHKDKTDLPVVKSIEGRWDAVTFFDSWEHIEDISFIDELDAGLFVVTVPNLPSLADEDFVLNWKHYKPNEHLHYFTRDSVLRFLSRHGYILLDVSDIEDVIRKPFSAHFSNTLTYTFKRGSA